MAAGLAQGRRVRPRAGGEQIPQEVPGILGDLPVPDRHVAPANHPQIVTTSGWKRVAEVELGPLRVASGGVSNAEVAKSVYYIRARPAARPKPGKACTKRWSLRRKTQFPTALAGFPSTQDTCRFREFRAAITCHLRQVTIWISFCCQSRRKPGERCPEGASALALFLVTAERVSYGVVTDIVSDPSRGLARPMGMGAFLLKRLTGDQSTAFIHGKKTLARPQLGAGTFGQNAALKGWRRRFDSIPGHHLCAAKHKTST